MASMGHDDGFARSLQGPLAVHFITFGKNNAHLAWRARSEFLLPIQLLPSW